MDQENDKAGIGMMEHRDAGALGCHAVCLEGLQMSRYSSIRRASLGTKRALL